MSCIRSILLIALTGFALRSAAQGSATNSWTIGSKTIIAGEVSDKPIRASTPAWRLRAGSATDSTQAGRQVHTLSVFFGVQQMPGPGRYHIVSADSALHADEASFMAHSSAAGPGGVAHSYSSTGTGDHYLTVSVQNGRVTIVMPAAPAYSDEAAAGAYISARLTETDDD